jgi:hypothetical protein
MSLWIAPAVRQCTAGPQSGRAKGLMQESKNEVYYVDLFLRVAHCSPSLDSLDNVLNAEFISHFP